MEEKERFELLNDNCIYDNKLKEYVFSPNSSREDYMKILTNLLNQQDKEIKKLCQQIIDLNKENNKLRKFRDDILRVQAEPYQFYKENQQLKQQLAEGKEQLIAMNEKSNKIKKESYYLKQQLAEKEKEIEKYRGANIIVVGERSRGKKHLMEIKIKELQNQKAIEQLNQIINLFEPYENEEKDTILCANNGISFLEYIYQQIALLKGKVEDVKD